MLPASSNKEARWKLFEHYSTRFLAGNPAYALTEKEFNEFMYLKYFFAEDYQEKKEKPWLPSVMDSWSAEIQ